MTRDEWLGAGWGAEGENWLVVLVVEDIIINSLEQQHVMSQSVSHLGGRVENVSLL